MMLEQALMEAKNISFWDIVFHTPWITILIILSLGIIIGCIAYMIYDEFYSCIPTGFIFLAICLMILLIERN